VLNVAVTLINVFIVPDAKEAEFLEHWRATTAVFSKRPGFLETHLHRNTGVGSDSFKFINIARWESAEAWRSNHDDYRPGEYSIAGVKGHPAIFECVADIYGDSAVADVSLTEPFVRAGFFEAPQT
jgi:quinol monooxygenase YgiN